MHNDWFEQLVGFPEGPIVQTQACLEIVGDALRSRVNGRVLGIGTLETPTLAELRARASAAATSVQGPIRVSVLHDDIAALHRSTDLRHALVQVSSRFNLLGMARPDITPDEGIARYGWESTQRAACGLAAPGATIYRHYGIPIAGGIGQTASRQLDCLADLGRALDNRDSRLWHMQNGYALCHPDGLADITRRLTALDSSARETLAGYLRIGVHWDIEVAGATPEQVVSQACCAALPVGLGAAPREAWSAFARLILEATYESTLCAAVINAKQTGVRTVLLTQVGAGALGNDPVWILDAMRRALRRFHNVQLDVRIVTRDTPTSALARLAHEMSEV